MSFDPQFYSISEYFLDLGERISRAGAGERVTAVFMSFAPSKPEVSALVDKLCAAARRGAKVTLVVDAINLMELYEDIPEPFFFGLDPKAPMPPRCRAALKAVEAVKRAGGRAEFINVPKHALSNPLAGRSHIKYSVVGDWVYTGGSNLYTLEVIDLMVGWNDATTAAWLDDLASQILTTGHATTALGGHDFSRELSPGVELLFDAGVRNSSIILERAYELIDSARERIYLTTQFFPSNEVGRRLAAAHRRGVEVTIIYNHPNQHVWPFNWLHSAIIAREHLRLPASFFAHAVGRGHHFYHAKAVATEQAAIVGSHNLVEKGVQFGTAENALQVAGPEFSERLVAAITRQL